MSFAVIINEIPAIANREALIDEVKAELNRDDITEAEIKSFIRRAEARFNRILRTPNMEVLATLAITGQSTALPADFMQLRAIYDAGRNALECVDPASLIEYTGHAPVYALIGEAIHVAPAPNTATNYTIVYWKRITALTADVPTNWVLDKHPDLYFYATLLGAESRIGNDERLGLWKAAFDETLGEIQADGLRNSYGGRLRMTTGVAQVRGVRA